MNKKILTLRIAYWAGIILDALAFIQMAFPEIGKKMLKVNYNLTPEYLFAINLAAGLMLAWTFLLFWADRKPLERMMVIPLTMIIVAWNIATMVYAINIKLIPANTLLPQLIMCIFLFFYYGFAFYYSKDATK